MIDGNAIANKIPQDAPITAAMRPARSRSRSDADGRKKVLYRSTLSELDSMNKIASLALISAEKTAANVKSPSHGGINLVITIGNASSRFDKFGYCDRAMIPRMAAAKAHSTSPAAFQLMPMRTARSSRAP